MREEEAVRVQVARQVEHWRAATAALDDFDAFASAAAWAGLERYLDAQIRSALRAAVSRLRREMDVLEARLRAAETGPELELLRRDVVAFRKRFLTVENVLEFYGDAVNTRTTPKLAAILRGCDELARMAMESVLVPLGRPVPAVLVFIQKGLGASILRAGQRLWDGVTLNPAAVVKVTRHNLCRPTALIHEAGHQVAAELGWAQELGELLYRNLAPISRELGAAWAAWSPEIVADVYAFVHTGYGGVAGLHDVVAGDQEAVFSYPRGDPHPIAYLRVLLGAEFCVRSFGAGPWDDLAEAWVLAHPLTDAPHEVRPLLRASLGLMPQLAELCLHAPLRAFGGRAVIELVDPRRVAPAQLRALERRTGPSALISPHWLRTEALRMLALTSFRASGRPSRDEHALPDYDEWMMRLGGGLLAAA
ncbi:MAG: hypothetical protein WAL63_08085 [Solirubrobacteraceae bacterium]